MAAIKPTFLDKPYGAYFHQDIPKEDEGLTHVGPGTPCGEYLRRFWQPVVASDGLTDLPKALRILDEELVVFRDGSGKVGLLELHCSHRGTSLEFGLIEQEGIRCCYHGWLYGVDGKILDTPGEPPDSTYKERLCHGAYPVEEHYGLVFAYMGPPDRQPPFPTYDSLNIPGDHFAVVEYYVIPCNWLQINDNFQDPIHAHFLHATISGDQIGELIGIPSQVDWVETPLGLVSIDTRRAGENVWSRLDDWIMPNWVMVPPTRETGKEEKSSVPPSLVAYVVPVDDTHTLNILLLRLPDGEEVPPERRDAIVETQRPKEYEEMQRHPSDYSAWKSQRPIAIHGLEHLAETDRGITMARNMLRQGIQAVQQGKDPKGILRNANGPISTYSSSSIRRIPPALTPEEDIKLLRQSGREMAEANLKNPPFTLLATGRG